MGTELLASVNVVYTCIKLVIMLQMEKIFSHAWRGKRGVAETTATEGDDDKTKSHPVEDYVDDEQGLQRKHVVDTTLIVHFFGKKGKNELRYEGFRR